MMVSFCAVLFPRGVLNEILNLTESVFEGFSSYSLYLLKLNRHVLNNVILSMHEDGTYNFCIIPFMQIMSNRNHAL